MHTPGPWKWRHVHNSNRGVELVSPANGMLLILDAVRHGMNSVDIRFAKRTDRMGGLMFKATSMVHSNSDYHEIDNPDARLIASAPDLLAACKLVASCWHGGSSQTSSAIDACKDAIAKAEGK